MRPVSSGWIARQPHQHNFIAAQKREPERHRADVCNFTPITRVGYRIGVPTGGYWRELLNSDAHEYNGTGRREHGLRSCRRGAGAWASVFAKTDFAASGALFLKAGS